MEIPTAILPFKRKTWIPLVEAADGSPTDSKMGGAPYLLPNEEHPICPNCGNQIPLFLQLNLHQIPAELNGEFGAGLIQLFYCPNSEPLCDVDCEAYLPFADSVVARLIKIEGETGVAPQTKPENSFPPKLIIDWTERDDYPTWEECRRLSTEIENSWWQFGRDEYSLFLEQNEYPRTGEKLSGWAAWVQGIEYPNCRICNEQMRLVFQIDSDQNLPFMFGDVGIGHLTQCPHHKQELGFGWACG